MKNYTGKKIVEVSPHPWNDYVDILLDDGTSIHIESKDGTTPIKITEGVYGKYKI